MNLHQNLILFNELVKRTSVFKGITEDDVKRDYYIVLLLKQLNESEFADSCVFKGGTSLSKCYPESINRFSEDIDLTFVGPEGYTNKQYDKTLKRIELLMSKGFEMEKIPEQRNDRNKSSEVWNINENKEKTSVKLEIGSTIVPNPCEKRSIKSFIQEYLESVNRLDVCEKYGLIDFKLTVLKIERTFLDKVMSVKRHAICGTLIEKTRHIYDITKLFSRPEIQEFLEDKEYLKRLLRITKVTDSYYLQKKGISKDYDPLGDYNFNNWKYTFNETIKDKYKNLINKGVYDPDFDFDFNKAIETFEALDKIFKDIGE